MNSASVHATEKEYHSEHTKFDKDVVDVAAQLTAGTNITIDPEISLSMR